MAGPDGERRRPGRWALAGLLAAALAAVAWLSAALPVGGRLGSAAPAERAAVVERALGNLKDLCRARARPREFCEQQARLVLDQPECDAACRDLARGELAADTARR